MDLSKLRTGELVAAIGGLVLLIAMFAFDWYEIAGVGGLIEQFGDAVGVDTGIKAWDGQGFFGTIANLVILAAALTAIGLAVLTATSRTVALPVAASAITAALGIAAVVMVMLRMVFQPGPNELVDLRVRHLAGAGRSALSLTAAGRACRRRAPPSTRRATSSRARMGDGRRPPPEPSHRRTASCRGAARAERRCPAETLATAPRSTAWSG